MEMTPIELKAQAYDLIAKAQYHEAIIHEIIKKLADVTKMIKENTKEEK